MSLKRPSPEHRAVFSSRVNFSQRYTLYPNTQVDFLDRGLATFTALRDNVPVGFQTRTPLRLEPSAAYRVTIKGVSLSSATKPLLYAEVERPTFRTLSTLVPGTSLLDRPDLLLPLIAHESDHTPLGCTTLLTNPSRYPTYVQLGIRLHEAKAGQEFRVEWIEVTKLASSMVTPHWRTVSDETGYATSYYDKDSGHWTTASLLLRP